MLDKLLLVLFVHCFYVFGNPNTMKWRPSCTHFVLMMSIDFASNEKVLAQSWSEIIIIIKKRQGALSMCAPQLLRTKHFSEGFAFDKLVQQI
jgi:hypothetical protein